MSVDDGKTVYGLLVLGLKVWLFGLDMLRDLGEPLGFEI